MFNQKRLIALTAAFAVLAHGLVLAVDSKPNERQDSKNIQQDPHGSPSEQTQDVTPEDIKKASEAFGHFIGRNLNTPAMQFDIEKIIQGMRDGMANKPAPMPDKDYEELMMRIQKKAFENLSVTNLKAAEEFMAKNAHAPNVVEIEPLKLQYLILTQGNGPSVELHATPSINYVGKYIDGTVFGSSEEAGGPINISLDQTLPAFSRGIVGMKEGEKRRLFVHPSMGYGTKGHLPPNSLLIFDIEVVKASTPKEAINEDEDDLPLSLDDEDNLDDDEDEEEDNHSSSKSSHSQSTKGDQPSTSPKVNKY
jgi:peptidylprolyl isomerase